MTVEQASTFFTTSILVMMGLVVIFGGVVTINNLLHKYWKPVRFFKFLEYPPQYQQYDQMEPTINVQKETSKKV